ncbi:MAG: indolepyruvate oxidoreductase subunit beta [Slackia sp.]|nr:indolepyruvate oxidoreductase subunit beta [Slackia sp.]
MKNIVLTGIGGQGTVLAAKVLAQAAQNRGWQVRTAETIGMAQRGGSVVSHVRMGDRGERVHAPLVSNAQADALIAFEPGEGARMECLLAPDGVLVSASCVVQPVTASLSKSVYAADPVLAALRAREGRTVIVDEVPILAEAGSSKVLNMALLAAAVETGALGITLDELKDAVRACVKPRFVDMNIAAIDMAVASMA